MPSRRHGTFTERPSPSPFPTYGVQRRAQPLAQKHPDEQSACTVKRSIRIVLPEPSMQISTACAAGKGYESERVSSNFNSVVLLR
eukprot:4957191-Pleurochrysis_carterae.AAC.1